MTPLDCRKPAPAEEAGRPPDEPAEPIEPSPWDGLWIWALTVGASEAPADGP